MNTHRFDRPQDHETERQTEGLFRCERCTMLWPLPYEEQNGRIVCPRDADADGGTTAAMVQFAEERAANAVPYDVLEYPPISAFSGAVMVTGISPTTLNLTRGGASGTIAITGVNLSISDTWSSSSATHITVTPTVNTTTSVTLTITANVTTTRGNYNLTFNGDTLTPRSILKVR